MSLERLERIKELINGRYSSHHCGYTEMRSEGNGNDVFQDGLDCGTSSILYEIGCILGMDLEDPEEQDFEY